MSIHTTVGVGLHVQSEDFRCVSCLDAVALALPGVSGNDREVRTGDGEDGAAVLRVGVELAFLGAGEGTVGHDEYSDLAAAAVGGRGGMVDEERERVYTK